MQPPFAKASIALNDLGVLLWQLGEGVRERIVTSRNPTNDSRVIDFAAGDTIYAIDRKVESTIISAIERWPNDLKPLLVVAEGFGCDGRRLFGSAHLPTRYRLLLDPIDGSRELMYDKRSAWFLAAIAPDHGEETRLSQTIASAMVELPTSKQNLADSFYCVRSHPVAAIRSRLDTRESYDITVKPSSETSLKHGFGHVSNFFPGTKQLAAELMERIAESSLGITQDVAATVFDDQYISTGGQFIELAVGHDRFGCDLRPIFYEILERRSGSNIVRGLECHPYDIAGLLVAEQAGVILTDGFGAPLDAPFSVSQPVHWCGYANEHLRAAIEPVIQDWLREKLNIPV